MKPILICSLLLTGLISCTKVIKKRDLKGRWDLHYTESLQEIEYPTTNNNEYSYFRFENNLAIFEYFSSSDNYKYIDTVLYLENYINLFGNYTFEEVKVSYQFNDSGTLSLSKHVRTGRWYFLSSSEHTSYQENERVCFVLEKERTVHNFGGVETIVEKLYQEHDRFFFWNITHVGKNEIRLESESNYVHDHNQHTDIEAYSKNLSIYKKH